MHLTYGSVCSGIEAASVAWEEIGWEPLWFSEIDTFPSKVLKTRWPSVLNLGDMTQIASLIDGGVVSAPDVLVGGTPCQSFSIAGLRKGLSDARGNLSLTYIDIANAIDQERAADGKQPCIIVWENVPGVLTSTDNAFGCFLAGLAGEDEPLQPPGKRWTNAGLVYGPQRAIAWRVLDAQYFGLAQRRKRVFVVASAREGFDPAEVFLEFYGMRRDSAPSREAPEGTTTGFETGPSGGRFTDLAPTLDTRCKDGPIRNQLGIGVLETFRMAAFGEYVDDGTASTMKARDYKDATDLVATVVHGTQDPIVSEDLALPLGRNTGQENAVCITGDITHTLKAEGFDASEDGTGRGQPITLASTYAVRRLMPVECARLQGFPDGHTQLDGKTPDGPQYKAYGNSMATPVIRWIGRRIEWVLKVSPTLRELL